ncbi:MAG: DUF421 domain-containing protein [Gammaproteobacteria bacterium]|nr:MAG: DUF421 domain-containing protein [Gammaproteobacteria bacterium]
MNLFNTDIHEIMHFTVPPLELFLRGTIMFWFLFLIFRLVLRRDIGSASVTDFLFVVILGDAAQNAMIGEGTSVSDGMVLVSTLVSWNYVIDALSYRYPAIDRLVSARKLCLIRDGKLQRRNLRKEFITVDEVHEKIREEGLEHIEQVKMMYMESDGEISIIKREDVRS